MNDETATRQTLKALAEAGLQPISVDYGDGEAVAVSSVSEAVREVMSVDEAYVILNDGRWVRFVLGNGDPLDLICDFTASLDSIIDPLMRRWGL